MGSSSVSLALPPTHHRSHVKPQTLPGVARFGRWTPQLLDTVPPALLRGPWLQAQWRGMKLVVPRDLRRRSLQCPAGTEG